MDPKIKIRETTSFDDDFIWNSYELIIRPILAGHLKNGWQSNLERENFQKIWNVSATKIITYGEMDVGWIAFTENQSEVKLDHFYLLPNYQKGGIGSALFMDLLKKWHSEGKTIKLTIVKNGPHQSFLLRNNFKIIKENGIFLELACP